MIYDGAEMLNYLRLSLIEQTRVLEGKPIPVDLKATPIKTVVERGAQFQKPSFVRHRTVGIADAPDTICADAMKLTTVFMSLIGNALKYSDGDIQVRWLPYDFPDAKGGTAKPVLLIAVLDQGTGGKGITEAQARQLFVPFGRLAAHDAVEGTGLGLLSVRSIVEAHGGEIYIEGTMDGTADAPGFTTTARQMPPALRRRRGQTTRFCERNRFAPLLS